MSSQRPLSPMTPSGSVYTQCPLMSPRARKSLEVKRPVGASVLGILTGHEAGIPCIAEMSDGSILSGSMDATVRLWDALECKQLRAMHGHSKGVQAVAAIGRTYRAASGSMDKTIRIWNTQTGDCETVLEGHASAVCCMLYLKNGQLLSGGESGRIRLWVLPRDPTPEPTRLAVLSEESPTAAASPEGADSEDPATEDGKCDLRCSFKQTMSDVTGGSSLAFVQAQVAAVEAEGTEESPMELMRESSWNTRESNFKSRNKNGQVIGNTEMHTFPFHSRSVGWLHEAENGEVISGSWDGTARWWRRHAEPFDWTVRKIVRKLRSALPVTGRDGKTWLLGAAYNAQHQVCLVPAEVAAMSEAELLSIEEHESFPNKSWPDAEEAPDPEFRYILSGHTDTVTAVSQLKDSRFASVSHDKTVRIWNRSSFKCDFVMTGHDDRITALLQLEDGRIATASADRTIRFWAPPKV